MSQTIKAIDKEAVHRICSGQVVLNLGTAVKELVENSLDAGASTVEVRLREYGSELIEVIDNGSGVLPSNFGGLTAKHHTSKIQDFSDLVNVETFGFRGEALSSLCAVGDVTISTKHVSEDIGSKLVFDHHGNITSTTPVARQIGTTVTVEKLFKSLPVRQKEFHRNLKREYFKMVTLLNAYGLISTNVRISCTNQTKKGGRSVIMSTHGCKSVKENIACIFGTKQLNGLLEIKKVLPSSEILEELKVAREEADKFELEGLISSCCHGQGRSSTDRQFFYINNRPCEPPKIVKSVNEVYHMFNMHQVPFVFLNITAARHTVDVNVTPDKRQIFLDHEKLLVATIKASLLKLYEKIPSTFKVNNIFTPEVSQELNEPFNSTDSQTSGTEASPSKLSSMNKWRSVNEKIDSNLSPSKRKNETKISNPAKQMKLDESFVVTQVIEPPTEKVVPSANIESRERPSLFTLFKPHSNGIDQPSKDTACNNASEDNFNSASSQTSDASTFLSKNSVESSLSLEILDSSSGKANNSNLSDNTVTNSENLMNCDKENSTDSAESSISLERNNSKSLDISNSVLSDNSQDIKEKSTNLNGTDNNDDCGQSSLINSKDSLESSVSVNKIDFDSCEKKNSILSDNTKSSNLADSVNVAEKREESVNEFMKIFDASSTKGKTPIVMSLNLSSSSDENEAEETPAPEKVPLTEIVVCDSVQNDADSKKTVLVSNVSVESIRQALEQLSAEEMEHEKSVTNKFHATIDPSKNQQAESELSREISKESFAKMEIIGQFNLGFIVVQLGSDLFIIDQHATDEKYNFETLQLTTTLSNQKLVSPQTLELTVANECLLLDNMDVFKKNGFEFSIDENAEPMKKVKLTAIPTSKNWHFGKDDIDELLFMLQDSPGTVCRPSRVRSMFASRACRMSVMIGTALKVAEMKRLVTHMGEIEQPWNCPHGRPTMRHLVNLSLLR